MGVIEPKILRAIRSVAEAANILRAGFTTVGEMSSLNAIYLKRAIEEGTAVGPRIIASGRALARTGGHGDLRRDIYELPEQHIRESLGCELCDGVDEVRKGVRKMQGWGADCIKFLASGGGLWENDRVTDQHYTLEEMKAIVEEAHMLGMRVNAHAEALLAIKAAVRAGVDVIHHGDVLDEAVCKEMATKGTVLVPTIVIYYYSLDHGWEVAPKKLQQKSFATAVNAGVKIALGSDTHNEKSTPYGQFGLEELEKLVEWGMSPMEAIVSATRTASDALGVSDKVGTVENGKLADLVLVNGNPAEDITILSKQKRIKKIYKDGKIVGR